MNQRAQDIRILSVSSTTSHKPIGTLVRERMTTLGQSLPGEGDNVNTPKQPILGIAITPSADLLVADAYLGDELTITNGTRREWWIDNAIDKLTIKNSATVKIELFLGETP